MKQDIADFRQQIKQLRTQYRSMFDKAVKSACQDMVIAAAESTPPLNGEDRGKNTVTGNLASHWGYDVNDDGDNTRITLYNNMQYASYVDQGHRMSEHFVPWLYIDGMGAIARHIPTPGEKLFGLVVGTKTEYVKGYGMVEKAKDRFIKSLTIAHDKLMEEVEGQLNDDN
jgi:hypothetical protein